MKKKILSIVSGFLMLGLLLVAPSINADANELKQSDITQNSFTISWSPEEDALKYYVYVGKEMEDYSTQWDLYCELPATQTSVSITGLAPGSLTNIKVTYDYYNHDKTHTYNGYVDTSYDCFTLPGKVKNVKQTKWWYFIKQFDVEWEKQEGVDGYEYIVKDSKNKKKAKGNLNRYRNYTTVSKVKNTMVYSIQVRAYKTYNGKKVYGAWSDKVYCFTQPRISKAKVSKNKLTVKWDKVSGATGYDVYVSTKQKSGYKKVKSVSSKTNTITIKKLSGKKLSSKKCYYVYVVTKKKVGKKTSTSGRLYYWNTKNSSFDYFN